MSQPDSGCRQANTRSGHHRSPAKREIDAYPGCFPDHTYHHLEDIEQRHFALSDTKGFLLNAGNQTIVDEVQYAPDLLSYM